MKVIINPSQAIFFLIKLYGKKMLHQLQLTTSFVINWKIWSMKTVEKWSEKCVPKKNTFSILCYGFFSTPPIKLVIVCRCHWVTYALLLAPCVCVCILEHFSSKKIGHKNIAFFQTECQSLLWSFKIITSSFSLQVRKLCLNYVNNVAIEWQLKVNLYHWHKQ